MRAPNFIDDYIKGLNTILNSVRMAILNEDENLFVLLNTEGNERAFQEPFLFQYYAHNKQNMSLWQIMFGYISPQHLNSDFHFSVYSDKNGGVYLPKIGYFKTDLPSTKLDFEYQCTTKSYALKNQNNYLDTPFTPNLSTKDKQVTFYSFEHDYFKIAFDHYDISSVEKHRETTPLSDYNFKTFSKAYKLLKNTNCNYFEMILNTLTGVYNFRSDKYTSFADRMSYGISFLSGTRNDTVVYFLVELAHQTGHTIFNTILQRPQDYFAIDIQTPMKQLTHNPNEHRNVYDAFHGLYTTSKVAETLDYFLANPQLFTANENHEIKGRLVDNSYRHKTGFHRIDVSTVFTSKGLLVYQKLNNYLERVYKKHANIVSKFPYVPDGFVFNYQLFLEQHPIKK